MHPDSLRVWPLGFTRGWRISLIMDSSRFWYMVHAKRGDDLDDYCLCVSGFVKDALHEWCVSRYKELVELFVQMYCGRDGTESLMKRVCGNNRFFVEDYRFYGESSSLKQWIFKRARNNSYISRQYYMDYYCRMADYLSAKGLEDDLIKGIIKKTGMPYTYYHGGVLSHEQMDELFHVL